MEGGAAKRLDKRTILVRLIREAPQQLIAAPAAITLVSDAGLWQAMLILGAFVALNLAMNALVWWRFTYVILADEMRIESGVVSRTKRSIPWDRIQDVEVERGPLHRLFGLAKVKLETGGSGSDEGALDSIALADADALRVHVRERKTGEAHSGQAAEDAATPVLELPLSRLLQAGFFNFSILWLALIFGALQTFEEWLPFGWDEIESWFGANQDRVVGMIDPVTVVSAIVLFLALGTLSGIVQMLVANYGFRLTLEGKGLRRVRGLFTRSEVVIPVHRIQLVQIAAHWIKRRMGWSEVSAQTLGGTGMAGGMQQLAPLADKCEATHVLTLAGGFAKPDRAGFVRVARVHPWVDIAENTTVIIAITLVAAWFWEVALLGLLLVPVAAMVSYVSDKPHAFQLGGGVLSVRDGWFTQKLWLLPVRNIQSFTINAGPLQRQLGLATVHLDSAGGSLLGLRIRNLPEKEAHALVRMLRGVRQ
jgi:putative membrane protein